MRCVAIIPAKGTSRRIPNKNRRMFHGEPIIAYSIRAAMASGLFDDIYVSTEDDTIADVAHACGAGVVVRPPELAEIGAPDCGTQEVTRQALLSLGKTSRQFDYACCIYPAAPLLNADDLRRAYRECYEFPYNYVFAEGTFYFGVAERFISAPGDFSYSLQLKDKRWIDINTLDDWAKAEAMYTSLRQASNCSGLVETVGQRAASRVEAPNAATLTGGCDLVTASITTSQQQQDE